MATLLPIALNSTQLWQAAMDAAVPPGGRVVPGWQLKGKTEVNRNPRQEDSSENPLVESTYALSTDVNWNGKRAALVFERQYNFYGVDALREWNSSTHYTITLTDPSSGKELMFASAFLAYDPYHNTVKDFMVPCFQDRDEVDRFRKLIADAIATSSGVYIGYRCGSCFTPDMQVQRRDGSPIGLGELAALNSAGRALPQIASLNEETGEVVYQTPVQVIDHGMHSSPVLQLASGLRVTPNHPLYVSQPDGSHTWKPAGELTVGDCLASPLSSCTPYVPSSTMTLSGAHQVFDLSMPGPHNFLVKSPGSSSWTVAHNKMIP